MINVDFVALEEQYVAELNELKVAIQNSEELQALLDSEENDDFTKLRGAFEPQIHALYEKVSDVAPLQIFALEKALLDVDFEGVYLGKILNYTLLRASVNGDYKANLPNDTLEEAILAFAGSVNFDFLKKVSKQALQVAFAVASDVWITSLLQGIGNRKIVEYLQGLKPYKREFLKQRTSMYVSLRKQFSDTVLYTFAVPKDLPTFRQYVPEIVFNLEKRISLDASVASFSGVLSDLLSKPEFLKSANFGDLLLSAGLFVEFSDEEKNAFASNVKTLFSTAANVTTFIAALNDKLKTKKYVGAAQVARLTELLTGNAENLDIVFQGVNQVYQEGLQPEISESIVELAKSFPDLSIEAKTIRTAVVVAYGKSLAGLGKSNNEGFFELFRNVESYINGFTDQLFSNEIKDVSLVQLKEFIRFFNNRRSAEYQSVKGFLMTTMVSHGFLTEKEVKELIKRKKVVVA